MKQIWYELRSQPVISAVTIIGTALAIFLIMVVVMLHQVTVIDIAPETKRSRTLYMGRGILEGLGSNRMSIQSNLSTAIATELTESLEGAEAASIYCPYISSVLASTEGNPTFAADAKQVDDGFFRIIDLKFIAGKPFDRADMMADLRKAVITESVARQAFASDGKEAVGRTLLINDEPWEVTGVVADVSPVTDLAYSQIWMPVSLTAPPSLWTNPNMGDMRALILPRPGQDEAVKQEVNRRLAAINTRLAADSCTLAIAGAPYDHEHQKADEYPNSLPDVDKGRRERWMLFGILLLIPAINLSSMTRSRLRRRVSEIGIRRAFGCTRMRIVGDILVENMVITLIGGVIGLLLCIGFGALLFDTVYSIGRWNQFAMPATLSAEALFDWSIGAYALLFCFILNLISTGVPALRASRINPVEAINQNK